MPTPPDVVGAHQTCTNHRDAIAHASRCGCFHCCATFSPAAIADWVDAPPGEPTGGTTALCPRCGIDSVIPLEPSMDETFLARMQAHWF